MLNFQVMCAKMKVQEKQYPAYAVKDTYASVVKYPTAELRGI